MNSKCKRGIASFLVLALTAMLCLGCGDDKEEEAVTIVIGEMTDLTGPASPAVIPLHHLAEDLATYYNEEGLIPGAKIIVVTYDTQFNAARVIPGYDWCRERGARVILGPLAPTEETLKPFAERDKVPVGGLSYTDFAAEPPGWVFLFTAHVPRETKTMLKWISEEHWDYTQGIPKVGFTAWRESKGIMTERAVREYCQAHPDKFDYVGGFMPPVGTMTFAGEVEKLKDCDYVNAFGYMAGNFYKEFRDKGYDATFFADSGASGFYEFFTGLAGWEALDGMLSTAVFPWWDEPSPPWDLVNEILNRYHPGQSPEDMGWSYSGGFYLVLSFFEVLRQAAEEVGAENFGGQAFYDAAVKFKATFEDLPEWGFTESKRHLIDHSAIYEWSAEAQGLVRLSDWLPFIME